jgi:S1-C subfamily serine protease
MANIKEDGWHLSKVIEGSGAQQAGIEVGDIVIEIADIDLTNFNRDNSITSKHLPEFEADEIVEVELLRDGEVKNFNVKATVLDMDEMFVDIMSKEGDSILEGADILSLKDLGLKNFKVMVFNGEDGSFKLNEDDIHMLFPDHLGEMNLFMSDGKSTSSLLGKQHEMSTLSSGLAKYFGTQGGVLVMHVDESNVFALEDGDVIKSVNGNKVNSPKDVIKQLLNSKQQEQIKLKIVRHKRNKTLKYNK